jgi:pimeloyl-ACP methyl ester carboxylesterase
MQFALNRLGFRPENVVLFAWSIGGYALSWAAMNYPEVKAAVRYNPCINFSFDN